MGKLFKVLLETDFMELLLRGVDYVAFGEVNVVECGCRFFGFV